MALKVDADLLANSTYVDDPYAYEYFEGGPLTEEENRRFQRAVARDRRRQLAQEAARQIGVIKTMQANGLSVKTAVITGVAVQFGQPEAVVSDSEINEWDLDLGTNTPQTRQ